MSKSEKKPLAIVDSNIILYALNTDYADQDCHNKCLSLLEKALKGQLDNTPALNPIVIAEVFTVLKKLISLNEAESRITGLLQSRRIEYISISKEACQTGVRWAKEYNIPINDALIAACAAEQAPTIYTADEHFKKIKTKKIIFVNPINP
ncbi:MAG: type II toxin-antitoxin system VapC family toxin [Candidatus Bathyarchaeia archaeon]|jgi:predicted nucleic acid-binding protein